jgi:hypothetical protein
VSGHCQSATAIRGRTAGVKGSKWKAGGSLPLLAIEGLFDPDSLGGIADGKIEFVEQQVNEIERWTATSMTPAFPPSGA